MFSVVRNNSQRVIFCPWATYNTVGQVIDLDYSVEYFNLLIFGFSSLDGTIAYVTIMGGSSRNPASIYYLKHPHTDGMLKISFPSNTQIKIEDTTMTNQYSLRQVWGIDSVL